MLFCISSNARFVCRCLAFACLLVFCLPNTSHASKIILKNGDQISGELIRLTEQTLVFKSNSFGELRIPWLEVQQLDTDQTVALQLSDGKQLKGKLRLTEDNQLLVQHDDENFTQGVRQDLLAINPPEKILSTKYTGRAYFGGTFIRGNSQEDQLNLDAEWVARNPQNRYTVALEVNEAQSAGIKTISTRRFLTQYDAFLNKKDYLFANARAEGDDQADLRLRTGLGLGYGRQLIESEKINLSAEAGVNYVKEDYFLSVDQTFPTLSLGLKYDRKLFNLGLVFFNNISADVNLENPQDALLKSRLGLRVPVAQGLNVSTQLNIDYDNEPAVGNTKTDATMLFSVGYGF